MTIRNPVTTVRQMCTDDVIHLYLVDMIQLVLTTIAKSSDTVH